MAISRHPHMVDKDTIKELVCWVVRQMGVLVLYHVTKRKELMQRRLTSLGKNIAN